MSNSPHISGIIPTILNPSEQAFVDGLKSSALKSQGIESGPLIVGCGSPSELPPDSLHQAPALIVDPSKVPEKKDPLILIPFEDGTVVKYVERGPGTSQQILITARGDQMAIVRDADCAELIADGVNVYFAALTEKQQIENELRAKSIAGQPAAEKSTDQLRSEAIESDLSTKLLKWLADQNVTSENIGEIRARLLLPFDCEWNSLVRDLTATFELASKNPKA